MKTKLIGSIALSLALALGTMAGPASAQNGNNAIKTDTKMLYRNGPVVFRTPNDGEHELNKEIEQLDGQSGDDASARQTPADSGNPGSAGGRKESEPEAAAATRQRAPKTRAGASTRKRRKPFVL